MEWGCGEEGREIERRKQAGDKRDEGEILERRGVRM